MSRFNQVTFEFVELLPNEVVEGVLYVSLEHRTIVHKCCCGCGDRVVIALSPAQWKFTFDGETISISPSIGNGGLPCNSHYWIHENEVHWAKPLTPVQTHRSRLSDRKDAMARYAPQTTNKSSKWNLIARLQAFWRARK